MERFGKDILRVTLCAADMATSHGADVGVNERGEPSEEMLRSPTDMDVRSAPAVSDSRSADASGYQSRAAEQHVNDDEAMSTTTGTRIPAERSPSTARRVLLQAASHDQQQTHHQHQKSQQRHQQQQPQQQQQPRQQQQQRKHQQRKQTPASKSHVVYVHPNAAKTNTTALPLSKMTAAVPATEAASSNQADIATAAASAAVAAIAAAAPLLKGQSAPASGGLSVPGDGPLILDRLRSLETSTLQAQHHILSVQAMLQEQVRAISTHPQPSSQQPSHHLNTGSVAPDEVSGYRDNMPRRIPDQAHQGDASHSTQSHRSDDRRTHSRSGPARDRAPITPSPIDREMGTAGESTPRETPPVPIMLRGRHQHEDGQSREEYISDLQQELRRLQGLPPRQRSARGARRKGRRSVHFPLSTGKEEPQVVRDSSHHGAGPAVPQAGNDETHEGIEGKDGGGRISQSTKPVIGLSSRLDDCLHELQSLRENITELRPTLGRAPSAAATLATAVTRASSCPPIVPTATHGTTMPTPVVAMGNRKSGMEYRPAGSPNNQAKGRTPHQQIPQPTNALSQQDSPTFPTGREDKKASYPPHAVPLAPLPVLHEITEEFIQRMEHYGEEPRLAANDDQHEGEFQRVLREVQRRRVQLEEGQKKLGRQTVDVDLNRAPADLQVFYSVLDRMAVESLANDSPLTTVTQDIDRCIAQAMREAESDPCPPRVQQENRHPPMSSKKPPASTGKTTKLPPASGSKQVKRQQPTNKTRKPPPTVPQAPVLMTSRRGLGQASTRRPPTAKTGVPTQRGAGTTGTVRPRTTAGVPRAAAGHPTAKSTVVTTTNLTDGTSSKPGKHHSRSTADVLAASHSQDHCSSMPPHTVLPQNQYAREQAYQLFTEPQPPVLYYTTTAGQPLGIEGVLPLGPPVQASHLDSLGYVRRTHYNTERVICEDDTVVQADMLAANVPVTHLTHRHVGESQPPPGSNHTDTSKVSVTPSAGGGLTANSQLHGNNNDDEASSISCTPTDARSAAASTEDAATSLIGTDGDSDDMEAEKEKMAGYSSDFSQVSTGSSLMDDGGPVPADDDKVIIGLAEHSKQSFAKGEKGHTPRSPCCSSSSSSLAETGVAAGRSTLGDEVPGLPVPSNSNFTANPLREKSKPHAVFRPDLCPDEAISVAGQRSGSDTADSFSGAQHLSWSPRRGWINQTFAGVAQADVPDRWRVARDVLRRQQEEIVHRENTTTRLHELFANARRQRLAASDDVRPGSPSPQLGSYDNDNRDGHYRQSPRQRQGGLRLNAHDTVEIDGAQVSVAMVRSAVMEVLRDRDAAVRRRRLQEAMSTSPTNSRPAEDSGSSMEADKSSLENCSATVPDGGEETTSPLDGEEEYADDFEDMDTADQESHSAKDNDERPASIEGASAQEPKENNASSSQSTAVDDVDGGNCTATVERTLQTATIVDADALLSRRKGLRGALGRHPPTGDLSGKVWVEETNNSFSTVDTPSQSPSSTSCSIQSLPDDLPTPRTADEVVEPVCADRLILLRGVIAEKRRKQQEARLMQEAGQLSDDSQAIGAGPVPTPVSTPSLIDSLASGEDDVSASVTTTAESTEKVAQATPGAASNDSSRASLLGNLSLSSLKETPSTLSANESWYSAGEVVPRNRGPPGASPELGQVRLGRRNAASQSGLVTSGSPSSECESSALEHFPSSGQFTPRSGRFYAQPGGFSDTDDSLYIAARTGHEVMAHRHDDQRFGLGRDWQSGPVLDPAGQSPHRDESHSGDAVIQDDSVVVDVEHSISSSRGEYSVGEVLTSRAHTQHSVVPPWLQTQQQWQHAQPPQRRPLGHAVGEGSELAPRTKRGPDAAQPLGASPGQVESQPARLLPASTALPTQSSLTSDSASSLPRKAHASPGQVLDEASTATIDASLSFPSSAGTDAAAAPGSDNDNALLDTLDSIPGPFGDSAQSRPGGSPMRRPSNQATHNQTGAVKRQLGKTPSSTRGETEQAPTTPTRSRIPISLAMRARSSAHATSPLGRHGAGKVSLPSQNRSHALADSSMSSMSHDLKDVSSSTADPASMSVSHLSGGEIVAATSVQS